MENINKRLTIIEERLSRLESELEISKSGIIEPSGAGTENEMELPDFKLIQDNSLLESKIGRYGLAWIGNIVLLLGIIFLTQWINSPGKPALATIIGFAAVAGLLIIQYFIRQSHDFLAFMFRLIGIFLLYYFTLRLHYFSSAPVIKVEYLGLGLVFAVIVLQLLLAIRSQSEFFMVLAILLGFFSGMVSDRSAIILTMNVVLSIISLFLLYRYGWKSTFIISLLLCYLVFLFWIFNNPLMGHAFTVIPVHNFGYIYLFACGLIYALAAILRLKDSNNQGLLVSTLWLNSLGFSLILLIFVLQFFTENYAGLFAIISLFCLGYAFVLRAYADWKFGSAFYALYGFLALSVAIYGVFAFPTAHLYLAVESLLVVSIALWFRNKLIVIMNGILFTLLLIVYFISKNHLDSVNIAYALVPLVTARVLNWKKQRLEIKTDLLRNLYLVAGFFSVLYALYQAVPGKYVTLSWTIAAVLYFLLSFILKNVKYRYMAIGTVIAGAFYLFIIDLSRIDIAYRVIAFLFLAIISIVASIYYSRRITKQEE